MNPQILTVLLGALSICATACGIGYIVLRIRTLAAYRVLLAADGDAVLLARETYFGLDRRHKRLAVFVLVIYGLTFLALSPFLQPASSLVIGCLILITLSVLSVGLTASICNDKEWAARMHDESRRRVRRFRGRAPLTASESAAAADGADGDAAAKPHTSKTLPVPQSDTCIPGRPSPPAGGSSLPNSGFVDTPRKTTCFSPHVHDIFAKGEGRGTDETAGKATDVPQVTEPGGNVSLPPAPDLKGDDGDSAIDGARASSGTIR